MKVLALIISIILVSPVLVAASNPATQTDVASMYASQEVHPYTGIIKNKTRYKISIPSKNSDATLIIPPHSWITYTIWVKHENVTAYHRGNPYYCLNILAHPGEYPFMCKKYDFMVEILPREPAIRHWPSKLKRRIRRG